MNYIYKINNENTLITIACDFGGFWINNRNGISCLIHDQFQYISYHDFYKYLETYNINLTEAEKTKIAEFILQVV